jgi:hypothetical protein
MGIVEVTDGSDGLPEFVDGAVSAGAEASFEFGEGHLDQAV